MLIDLSGSTPGTDAAVYVGKYMGSLSVVASNAFGNPDRTARCVFQATAGVLYEVAVDVTTNMPGPVQLSLLFTNTYFPPQITQQPADQAVVEGTTATFSVVAATDSPLTYQWMFQGTNVAGGTNSTLLLTNVTLSEAGAYQVLVSNLGGSTNSQANLTVFARPPNDNFANSIALSGTSVTTSGTDVYASSEPGEPSHAGWASGESVWWNWTAPDTGIVTVSVNNYSGISQVLDVYAGGALAQLTEVAPSSQWLLPPIMTQFVASKGTNYQIAVTGVNQQSGTFQLGLTFTPTNFPPVITTNLVNQTVLQGGTASFQVSVSSELPVTYQWFFNTNTLLSAATTASLVLSNAGLSQAGAYEVIVSNASGFATSQASLVVNVPPPNDDFSNSITLPGLNFTTTGNNQFATSEPNEPAHAGYGPGASVWWNWTTPAVGEAYVNVTGFSTAETLAIYTGANLSQLSVVATNAWDAGPLAAHFAADAGATYQIAVSDPNGAGGIFQLQVQLALSNFPPVIVAQPPPVTNVIAGAVVQFLYTVTNDFSMTNQWFFQQTNSAPVIVASGYAGDGDGPDGGPGGGGTNGGGGGVGGGPPGPGGEGDGGWDLWLNLTNVNPTNSGYYYTVITSIGGSVTSAPVQLIVHFPPPNDNFTNRIPLAGPSVTAAGTTAYSTLETNEPAYTGLTSGGSVWWTWTAPDAGTESITVTNDLGAFQILQIYTGGTLSSLVPVVRSAGAQNVLSTSFITTPGTAYQIAVVGGESPIQLGLQFTDANIPPQITQQPMNTTNAAGSTASFRVGAAGGGMLYYQWFFNTSTLIPGATNSSLDLPNVTTTQAGQYSVTVSNLGGSISSSNATLAINSRPANDDFVNRFALTGTSTNTTASDQYATFETGEPAPYPAGGWNTGKSVWWSWTAPMNGILTLGVTNSMPQILAVYTGANLTTLSVVTNGISYAGPLAETITVTSGTPYQIAVAAPGGEGGPFILGLQFHSVIFPPVIAPQPLSVTVTNGGCASFQVAATGAAPLSCQWQFFGTNLPGATNFTLQLCDITTNEAGNYDAVVSNPGGSTNSRVAVLRVLQYPPNDDFTNRIPLSGEATNVTGSNNYGSSEPGEPAHAGYGPFATVWWSYAPPALGLIQMDLTNSFSGAVLAVYTGNNVSNLTLVSSNAFANADGTGKVSFLGQPGTAYQIAVQGDLAGLSGNISLSVDGIFPPTITSEPQDESVAQGETAVFNVMVQSQAPLGYQWFFNGAAILA